MLILLWWQPTGELLYHTTPNDDQVYSAHAILDAGADIIIGNHPHVLQPMKSYTTVDGRQAFIIYSLGNFISSQTSMSRRSTAIMYIGITKPTLGGKAFVNGARYLPVYVNKTSDRGYVPQVIDVVGGFETAREFILKILGGSENVQNPNEPIITNSECQSDND